MSTQGQKLVARILNRRGNRVNLPQPLEPGELGWCQDTTQLFIGLNSDYALKVIEIFNGIPPVVVSTILDTQIIQLSTPYVRLNTPAVVTTATPNEELVLEQLGEIPYSSFILEQNKFAISALEAQIEIMNKLRLKIGTSIINNYPFSYAYDWDVAPPQTAQATCTLLVDVVDAVSLVTGYEGLGYTTAPTVSISGGGGSGADITAEIDANGTVVNFIINSGGTGYTVPPTLTLSVAPTVVAEKSTNLYKFTYIIGIDTIGGSAITDPELEVVLDSAHLNDIGNANYMYDGVEIIYGNAGLIGNSANVDVYPFGVEFLSGLLYMPTLRQTSNLAGMINKLSPPAYDGLVTSKQNVEVLTEYSDTSQPFTYYRYKLAPSVTFVNVENLLGDPYNSPVLSFDALVSDVAILDYSVCYKPIDATLLVRNGTLKVSVLTAGDVKIDDIGYENRDASILGDPEAFLFSASYLDGVVYITYKHDFASSEMFVATTIKKWNSIIT